ncbi:MAG: histidine phosphatase family protein [Candidatus Pelagibacter sp.]
MNKILTILIIGMLNFVSCAYSDDKILNLLNEGKKLIFIRHAIAPGNGDPNNFNIEDCSTQRNLDSNGIEQSKKIGLFFKNNNIKIDKILSSEWCRCKDTANYAFGNFQTFDALNSFYDERFADNETKQIKDLKQYVKNWDSDKNLIFVTHYVVISSILSTASSSGELVISDKHFGIIGRKEF